MAIRKKNKKGTKSLDFDVIFKFKKNYFDIKIIF